MNTSYSLYSGADAAAGSETEKGYRINGLAFDDLSADMVATRTIDCPFLRSSYSIGIEDIEEEDEEEDDDDDEDDEEVDYDEEDDQDDFDLFDLDTGGNEVEFTTNYYNASICAYIYLVILIFIGIPLFSASKHIQQFV
ncbi:MAG: hypothetical protein EZS28_009720 [Streblomastix strix]|uniref:Uncharacterized protein n=1 Tax=Streblomastix strix TaxID=222440 RepID=A0A5J4WIF2_9EUKA|nr:MAG: hypothetical protein EZS28_009720 [Streblomastix strix]